MSIIPTVPRGIPSSWGAPATDAMSAIFKVLPKYQQLETVLSEKLRQTGGVVEHFRARHLLQSRSSSLVRSQGDEAEPRR